jgi:hypothetical protein
MGRALNPDEIDFIAVLLMGGIEGQINADK